MGPIEKTVDVVVNEGRLSIVQKYENLITKIILTVGIVFVSMKWSDEKDTRLAEANKSAENYRTLLEVSLQVDSKVKDMNLVRDALKFQMSSPNPTKK